MGIQIIYNGSTTPADLDCFYDMVVQAGQVHIAEEVLRKNIGNAHILGFSWCDDDLAAIAAIKHPQKSYVRKVFANAHSPLDHNTFHCELGYCYTAPEFRGDGLCHTIISTLLAELPVVNIFATTRNPKMASILQEFGFRQSGQPYLVEGAAEPITLYTLLP